MFLKFISAIYFVAFLSWYLQIEGLYGENGVLPVFAYLKKFEQETTWQRYFFVYFDLCRIGI